MRSLPTPKSASPRSPFGACETESVTWIKRQATWVGNAVSSGPEDVAGVSGDEFAAKASLRLRGRPPWPTFLFSIRIATACAAE
jgi:hypothetical protein